ncbi:unnamed protein product [Moneuplotes crassus]|uniref:RecQ mediated genome instability protein 1 OB-fold domain-containing protein n=1 Tax=Euplotes crassus TaxID=5936 RepID=A0AAD2D1T2_EUPCR|nr:unnamed protein product [Moneuplotes crassus]
MNEAEQMPIIVDPSEEVQDLQRQIYKKYGIYLKYEWLEIQLRGKHPSSCMKYVLKKISEEKLSNIIDESKRILTAEVCKLSAPNQVFKQNVMVEIMKAKNIGGPDDVAPDLEDSDEETKDTVEEQKIENIESRYLDAGDENQSKKKSQKYRIYKFLLTDGKNKVVGFEQNFVKKIPNDIKSGTKIIIGPEFEVRMGHILLRNENTVLFCP